MNNLTPRNLATLAVLLERMESQGQPVDADQYRRVVLELSRGLAEAEPGPMLDALLAGHAGAAQIYENHVYAHAGLCRAPLEAALGAELMARGLIERVRRVARAERDSH